MNSSETAKWTELWLDSAGERAYQPALVSTLAQNGYNIIHNTSHNSLELGKDIICYSPEGELLALQLKGNPGTRLTMSQWHALQNQILQLVTTPIPRSITGRPTSQHTPIIVTNGEIEEDVHAAITNLNNELVPQYKHSRPIQVWSRGKLIELFTRATGSVWPTELNAQLGILKSIAAGGRRSLDLAEFHSVITGTLGLNDERPPSASRQIERALGLSVITSIYVSKYVRDGNLYEAIKAKTLALVNIVMYWHKNGNHRYKSCGNLSRQQVDVFDLLKDDLFSLIAHFSRAIARKHSTQPWINGNIFAEFGVMHPRRMMVTAVLAAYYLEKRNECEGDVVDIINQQVDYPFLESEALVPSFLAVFWAKEHSQATRRNEVELISVLNTLIRSAETGDNISSYYSVSEAVACRRKMYLGRNWHEIDRDQRSGVSQFAYPLMLMIIKRNWKVMAKAFWPEVTRLVRQNTQLTNITDFGFFRTDNAKDLTKLVEYPKTWSQLTEEVGRKIEAPYPNILICNKPLLILLLIFLPFRAKEDLILWLDRELCETWY